MIYIFIEKLLFYCLLDLYRLLFHLSFMILLFLFIDYHCINFIYRLRSIIYYFIVFLLAIFCLQFNLTICICFSIIYVDFRMLFTAFNLLLYILFLLSTLLILFAVSFIFYCHLLFQLLFFYCHITYCYYLFYDISLFFLLFVSSLLFIYWSSMIKNKNYVVSLLK